MLSPNAVAMKKIVADYWYFLKSWPEQRLYALSSSLDLLQLNAFRMVSFFAVLRHRAVESLRKKMSCRDIKITPRLDDQLIHPAKHPANKNKRSKVYSRCIQCPCSHVVIAIFIHFTVPGKVLWTTSQLRLWSMK